MELACKKVGLDIVKFKADYEGKAKELFEEDFKLSRELGVRGFPTIFFTDTTGNKEMVYGSKPYESTWSFVFSKYQTLTAKEFSVFTRIPRNECEKYLDDLTSKGQLEKLTTKNGAIWTLKNTSR